jgi:hypothetical protein
MERFGKSYSTLRTGFDLKPWMQAAAQSRGLAETLMLPLGVVNYSLASSPSSSCQ